MSREPRATVLLAVYNGARWLGRSLDSVLKQDWRDFEMLVVDDASTDGSPAVLAAVDDDRLVVLRNESNLGLTASLNRGLALARGAVILRHDADDLSLPGRFARQMAFMDAHPDVGVCGSWAAMVGENDEALGLYRVPTDHGPIVWQVGFGHGFAHPCVALRTGVVRDAGGYDENWRTAQDQELWTRLAWTTRLANIAEPLVEYRVHGAMASRVRSAEQRRGDVLARQLFLQRLLGREVPEELLRWNFVPPLSPLQPQSLRTQARGIGNFATLALAARSAVRDGFCATAGERREVSRLAGRKLHALAAQAAGCSLPLAAGLLARAVALDPSLLSPSELGRVVRAAARSLTGGRR